MLGLTTIASGGGSSVAWVTSPPYTFVCAASAASNTITISVKANANRVGTLQVDNIFLNPLSV